MMTLSIAAEMLELAGEAAPLGVAGLVACMWLVERRASVDRERQLTESHDRVLAQRLQLDALVELVRDNTRALAGLEDAQRRLREALRDVSHAVGSAESAADARRRREDGAGDVRRSA